MRTSSALLLSWALAAQASPFSLGLVRKAQTPTISSAAVQLIEQLEGFRANFYSINGDKTIGYGHDCTQRKDCGSIHAPITKAQGQALLMSDLPEYEACVCNLPNSAKLNANQYGALTSFTYNSGCGNVAKYFDAAMQSGDPSKVCQELPTTNTLNGELSSRRQKEGAFCSQPTSEMAGCNGSGTSSSASSGTTKPTGTTKPSGTSKPNPKPSNSKSKPGSGGGKHSKTSKASSTAASSTAASFTAASSSAASSSAASSSAPASSTGAASSTAAVTTGAASSTAAVSTAVVSTAAVSTAAASSAPASGAPTSAGGAPTSAGGALTSAGGAPTSEAGAPTSAPGGAPTSDGGAPTAEPTDPPAPSGSPGPDFRRRRQEGPYVPRWI